MNPLDGLEFSISAKPLYILVGLAFASGLIGWLSSIVVPRFLVKYISIGLFLVSFYFWIKALG